MPFVDPSSKLERAIRWFLIAQSKASIDDTFISGYSELRSVLPNRTIAVETFSPGKASHRPEGICVIPIRHLFSAVLQPGETLTSTRRIERDEFVGGTIISMEQGDPQSFNRTAAAITAAGRDLAVDHSAGADPLQLQSALDNADMTEFRCDWIRRGQPFLRRGIADDQGTLWMVITNYEAFVSAASNGP